ncbi:hypothetical protein [Myxococcus vastator]|uniref:hypothetical protein n=1 Tax=Myxococcus vastator TaxID=2709664 RepID=UPI0013D590C1|nr:hypothetical protein [Myxococcus vastator]
MLAQDDDCFDATGAAWLNHQAQSAPENEAVLVRALADWGETRTHLMQWVAPLEIPFGSWSVLHVC